VSEETITVNEIGLHMSPIEWVHFREWAGLGKVSWDTPLELAKVHEFQAQLKRAAEDLYYWQYKDATNFTGYLYTLIGKADVVNIHKIGRAFPVEVCAWHLWQSGPEKEFFHRFGIRY
jgi:hypothetical protein